MPAPLLPLLVFSLIFTCQVHPHVGGFAFAGPSACDSPSPALPEPVFSCWLELSPNVTSSKKSSLVTSSKAAAPPTPHVPTLYRIALFLLSKEHSLPIGRFLFLFLLSGWLSSSFAGPKMCSRRGTEFPAPLRPSPFSFRNLPLLLWLCLRSFPFAVSWIVGGPQRTTLPGSHAVVRSHSTLIHLFWSTKYQQV